jgi:hypothetical protein
VDEQVGILGRWPRYVAELSAGTLMRGRAVLFAGDGRDHLDAKEISQEAEWSTRG